jgi:hypothetical protein
MKKKLMGHLKSFCLQCGSLQGVVLILSFCLSLSGCGDALDRSYNEATLDKDATDITAQTDSTRRALLLGTIIRFKFETRPLEGMTYRELLEEGEKYKADQQKRLDLRRRMTQTD